MHACATCKYEEFFLSSWTASDPGMVVDSPATNCIDPHTGRKLELSDVVTFQVITPDRAACYAALGLVHTLWPHIPKEFDDYARMARAKGFLMVSSSPLTRSSYHAGDDFERLRAARTAALVAAAE